MLEDLVVFVGIATCLEAVAIFLIFRVLRSVERAVTKVDLLVQLASRTNSPSGDSPEVRITSACPVPVLVEAIDIVAEGRDRKKSVKESFAGYSAAVAPYSTSKIDLEEVLEPICQKLGVSGETTPVRFWAVVHHRAYGKRFSTESLPQSGVILEGRLIWSEPPEGTETLHRLSWEGNGIAL